MPSTTNPSHGDTARQRPAAAQSKPKCRAHRSPPEKSKRRFRQQDGRPGDGKPGAGFKVLAVRRPPPKTRPAPRCKDVGRPENLRPALFTSPAKVSKDADRRRARPRGNTSPAAQNSPARRRCPVSSLPTQKLAASNCDGGTSRVAAATVARASGNGQPGPGMDADARHRPERIGVIPAYASSRSASSPGRLRLT